MPVPPPATTMKLDQLHHTYLHGGLTIEFIGEVQYKNSLPFVGLDLSILVLQLALFSLNFAGTAPAKQLPPPGSQPRHAEGAEDGNDDEESRLHDVAAAGEGRSGGDGSSAEEDEDEDEDDGYSSYSGQLVVARIEVLRTLRHAWNAHLNAAASAGHPGTGAATPSSGSSRADDDMSLESAAGPNAGGERTAARYGSTEPGSGSGSDANTGARAGHAGSGHGGAGSDADSGTSPTPTPPPQAMDPASIFMRLWRNYP